MQIAANRILHCATKESRNIPKKRADLTGEMEIKALRIFYGLTERDDPPQQKPLLVGSIVSGWDRFAISRAPEKGVLVFSVHLSLADSTGSLTLNIVDLLSLSSRFCANQLLSTPATSLLILVVHFQNSD